MFKYGIMYLTGHKITTTVGFLTYSVCLQHTICLSPENFRQLLVVTGMTFRMSDWRGQDYIFGFKQIKTIFKFVGFGCFYLCLISFGRVYWKLMMFCLQTSLWWDTLWTTMSTSGTHRTLHWSVSLFTCLSEWPSAIG